MTAQADVQVLVVGAGAAGLMAGIAASRSGAGVVVVERNGRPGRKLLLTGGGRCNVTHVGDAVDLVSGVPGNGRFLYPAFSSLSSADLRDFLARRGVGTVAEPDGRVFPESNRAQDVLQAMVAELTASGAEVRLSAQVTSVTSDADLFTVCFQTGPPLTASRLILATGGLSYPGTGSTGDGFAWAAQLGHRVMPPRPALVGLETAEQWSRSLSGLALRDVEVALLRVKQAPPPVRGDLLFTHFGVSGPPVLNFSRFAVLASTEGAPRPALAVTINAPAAADGSTGELAWVSALRREFGAHPKRAAVTILSSLYPRRLAEAVLGDQAATPAGDLSTPEVSALASSLYRLELTITGSRPIAEAIVTQGGVDTREVDPRTLQSKLVPGLYFAGELLDVDGFTGGYNLQAAFSTGWLAGTSAAAG